MNNHNKFMNLAFEEAKKSYKKSEVPVGAVIVCKDKVIAKAHNNRESKKSVLGHAEIVAIKKANKKLKSWRLEDCILYVTLEPCPMCAGAIIQSRIKTVYYSASDLKSGVANSIIEMFKQPFNHQTTVSKIDDDGKSEQLLKSFFKEIRNKK